MKKTNLDIYRSIVGYETGFAGEGNDQWFYTLSLVINLMLVWWLNPQIALLFTVLTVIHYLTVFLYGFLCLECVGSAIFAYIYYAIHLVIIIVAFFADLKWTIITASITIIAYLFAPDCTETSILPRRSIETRENLALKHNTMILVAFVIVDFILPIKWWIKPIILVTALIIHPLIDWIEGYGISFSDVTEYTTEQIKESIIE